MLVVFTIGHSTRTWEAFLELLRVHGVKRLVDVRSIPRSRRNPQFNRKTLSAKCDPRGLAMCICASWAVCATHGGIHQTWAGTMRRFAGSPIICKHQISMRGWGG